MKTNALEMSLEELEAMDRSNEEEFLNKIKEKIRNLNSETLILQNRVNSIKHDIATKSTTIAENMERIRLNRTMPYLVGNVVEIFDDKSGVVNASTRMSSYLSNMGLVPSSELRPGDLVALHKDTNIVFEKLPPDYDIKVKAMELNTKPDETYEDIGGLERQMEELNEAVILPLIHPEKFEKLNIRQPKGVLMYGPPGTGKTLMARACASKTDATFLKLSGPQLVQMYIGDGARLVRDTFALARDKKPTIIFIDEIDAIGAKRSDSDRTGDREVQRTMLELLNQLDGFSSIDEVKVIAATNRVDILDPALLRSGRLDRKIEFPIPNVLERKRILQIHSRKMSVREDMNFDELARSTEGFNGAQCRAVCIEAGMVALRKCKTEISQNDFMDGIQEVLSRKKSVFSYFT